MALGTVQRREAPNDAWWRFESNYRAKATREILWLSHEVNEKTMQPGNAPFQFMMQSDRLVVDLHRLGNRSVTELRKCVIIVVGIKVRILENNPAGLDRAVVERVEGNQYNMLLRQQHDSKTLSASGSTTTADRGEKKRRPRNWFEGHYFNWGRKNHRAEDCRSVKKVKKSEDVHADKKSGGRGKC